MGADLNGATYPDAVVFTMNALPRFFTDLVRLFSRFFAVPDWTDEELRKEKQVVLRQLEAEDAGFEDEIEYRYRATEAGAFPVMGSAESVEALTKERLLAWRADLFRPDAACLCIAGSFTKGMEAAAIAMLSQIPAPVGEAERTFTQTLPQGFCMRDEASDWIDTQEEGLAQVHLAFDIDDETVYPVIDAVISSITAGSSDSLLFEELREEQALVA